MIRSVKEKCSKIDYNATIVRSDMNEQLLYEFDYARLPLLHIRINI